MMGAREKIYNFVSKIPKGKVATYGQVAKECGVKSPRQVGFWLHKNVDPKKFRVTVWFLQMEVCQKIMLLEEKGDKGKSC